MRLLTRILIRRAAWLVAVGFVGCNSAETPPPSKVISAQLGLFFGGQIQQRIELPLELDSTRQTQGFRLQFARPLLRPAEVEWTLNFPTARTGVRGPSNSPRAERTERLTVPAGADRFEQLLTFRTTDVPGTYNLRVFVDEELVLDRPFRLVNRQLTADD